MGRGVIDRPMDDIIHLLETYERRKEWDRYLVVREKGVAFVCVYVLRMTCILVKTSMVTIIAILCTLNSM